jgi:hypothetical protein
MTRNYIFALIVRIGSNTRIELLNWLQFDILSLFGILASVTVNFVKILLKPDNDCHKFQFINSTKDGKVEILENYIHGKQVSSSCSWSLP